MPIIIKDMTWSQTEAEVKVMLKFKTPKNRNSMDIFTSPNYLKLHSSPFFWEVFLAHDVRDDESKCQIFDGLVQFILKKSEPGEWKVLEKEFTTAEKAQIREKSLQENQKKAQLKTKDKLIKKEEKKREEIMKSTSRDAQVRIDYENMEKDIANKFKERFKVAKAELNSTASNSKGDDPAGVSFFKPKVVPKLTPALKKSNSPRELSPIRPYGEIHVTFTERQFPTPQRESMMEAEREWLLKQKEMRKAVGFVEEELTPAERNPEWLKTKGDSFFEQKNYRGAISAYSAAIRMTEQYYELFLNRSAAHFQLENYQRCIEDCTRALELLVPECDANLEPRKNCLARRGAALCRLGLVRQAYGELVAAVKLDPRDDVLRRDAEMLRCKVESGDCEDSLVLPQSK